MKLVNYGFVSEGSIGNSLKKWNSKRGGNYVKTNRGKDMENVPGL